MSATVTMSFGSMLLALRVVRLDHRAEHLLRALGRRQVRDVLGVEVLEVLHPPRRAARELRERHRLALDERLVEAAQELRAFLDDGEVGAEVRVEHLVEARELQRGVHLVGHRRAGLAPEALADAGPRARRRLDDDVLGGVVDGAPDLVRGVGRVERTGRAAVDALAAVDAHDVAEGLVQVRRNPRLVAAADGFEHADFLDVDARAHAAAAQDALVHVADDRIARLVFRHLRLGHVPEPVEVDAVLLGQRLQLAVVVALAAVALAVVRREQQVEDVPPRLAHLARVRLHFQRAGNRERAGRLQRPLPFHLDHADAAHARHAQVGVVAQRRYPHADPLRGVEHRRAHRHLDVGPVDGDRDLAANQLHHVAAHVHLLDLLAARRPRRVRSRFHFTAHRSPRIESWVSLSGPPVRCAA